ncbi:hypothetical protein [Ruegeria arenilitoris]|uniref:Uncharacterized protein n=1 Tax=Ruegeria arenilitoris TaxID=1173585 RepID=A0A238JWB8_9RHOB|nr:hypothetical protein [Ruegeria arenilitoris]SMX34959.1 hypothetical protein RUA8715_00722 [Ruegeria arenilitoris]
MPIPVIKIVSGPSTLGKGTSDAVTAGLGTLLSAGSAAADRLPFDREQLFGVLHFRLYETEQARKRARWFGGRIYNTFSGADPDYVPVSGTHLMQMLDAIRIQAPDFVVASGQYLLRYDYAKRAYDQIKHERAAEAV